MYQFYKNMNKIFLKISNALFFITILFLIIGFIYLVYRELFSIPIPGYLIFEYIAYCVIVLFLTASINKKIKYKESNYGK